MKTKRFSAFLCAAMLLVSLLTPSMAAEPEHTVIDLGDGFYLVEVITQSPMTRAGDTVSGRKTGYLYQGSTQIGTATLTATFDITSSTVRATDATISGTGSNGWSYTRGTTRLIGNKATGTAYFKSGSTEKSVTVSLTCSPDGTLS